MTIGKLSHHSDVVRLVHTVAHWWRTIYVKCNVKKVAISVCGSETSVSLSLWALALLFDSSEGLGVKVPAGVQRFLSFWRTGVSFGVVLLGGLFRSSSSA
ncbi:hypothetical protein AVEN_224451-1 [Araneus ventricosus]|uniref:Uncharacterized protein n=1 Tax=Araneus ventricosus TaxID=182803 RepID=A0A4Y2SB86_ARAVE|nr:hypothetical protein AVEN_224451-1 [Araneus ventricosus]